MPVRLNILACTGLIAGRRANRDMFNTLVLVVSICGLALAGVPFPVAASGIPDTDISVGYADEEKQQRELIIIDALAHERDGAVTHWKSPKSRARGRIKILSTTGKPPLRCRSVRITDYAARGSKKISRNFTMCRQVDGNWNLSAGPTPNP